MKKGSYRIEQDTMGEVFVPKNALYGAQTQRAIDNFVISDLKLPKAMIKALGLIKAAAAEVNGSLGLLNKKIADAIEQAATEVINGKHDQAFLVDVFQTGSGTSSNMNANEVIANIASLLIKKPVHPNDHVNMGQSSNDVIPTAIHVGAALLVHQELIPALQNLEKTIQRKARKLDKVVTTGRTHLMDAMPVTYGQILDGWQSQIKSDRERIRDALQKRLTRLSQGGSAVGTGINTHAQFGRLFALSLKKRTKIPFKKSTNYFAGLSSQDDSCEMSGQLKTLAVSFMKIANDLRWMNSGPLAGLGEIELPALQPGSSIMPGKVNPVIPEAVAMASAQVIGNDATITIGGQSGNFQLNVMLPVIGYNLCQSISLMTNSANALAKQAISGFKVNQENIQKALEVNPILVTSLNPIIGYEMGAKIAKLAYAEKKPVREIAMRETNLSQKQIDKLLDPLKLTKGGIVKK